jgi:alpha-L-rhamnosidase
VYLGEVYDARQEKPGWDRIGFNDSSWHQASLSQQQLGDLHPQMLPAIRVTAKVKPVAITEPKPGVYIFDMGQNFAGWAKLRVRGPAGTQVKMRFGELLYPDGTLNVMTSVCGQIKPPQIKRDQVAPEFQWDPNAAFGAGAPVPAEQSDVYILRGGGREEYTPRFTFHGFRYVEVTGLTERPGRDDVEGLRLNADVEHVGEFSCSNDLLNRIHKQVQWTFLSNLFSVQSDCPHREKFGYGGDMVPTSEAFLLNFDMAGFYNKVVRDYADAQRDNGGMTETAPFVGIADQGLGGQSGPIGWQIAHPFLQ